MLCFQKFVNSQNEKMSSNMKKIILILLIQILGLTNTYSQKLHKCYENPHFWIEKKIIFIEDTISKMVICNDTINQFLLVKSFQKNKRFGYWVYFRRNGYKIKEGYYDLSTFKKDGTWRYYNKNHVYRKSIIYKQGKKVMINKHSK